MRTGRQHDQHHHGDHEPAALADLQVLGGDEIPGGQPGERPWQPRAGRARPLRIVPRTARVRRLVTMGLPVGSSRTRTSPPATPGSPGGRRRRYPPATSRRLMSATSSREAPAGRVTVSPVSARAVPAAMPAWSMSRAARAGSAQSTCTTMAPAPRISSSIGPWRIDPAVVDDRHRVAGALDLVQQVRGQHHGPALVGQAGDHRPHLVHARRVEPVHRLVQDQQLGVAEQAGGHAQALAHAHRVRGDLVVGALGQADPVQRRRRSALRRRRPWPRPACEGCPARSGAGGSGARRRSRRPGPAPASAGPGRGARAATSCRRRPGSGRAGCGSGWSCPRRSGPGSRTRDPRGTRNSHAVDRHVGPEPLGQAAGLHRPSSAGRSDGTAARGVRVGAIAVPPGGRTATGGAGGAGGGSRRIHVSSCGAAARPRRRRVTPKHSPPSTRSAIRITPTL